MWSKILPIKTVRFICWVISELFFYVLKYRITPKCPQVIILSDTPLTTTHLFLSTHPWPPPSLAVHRNRIYPIFSNDSFAPIPPLSRTLPCCLASHTNPIICFMHVAECRSLTSCGESLCNSAWPSQNWMSCHRNLGVCSRVKIRLAPSTWCTSQLDRVLFRGLFHFKHP